METFFETTKVKPSFIHLVREGNLEEIKLLTNIIDRDINYAINIAAEYGYLDVVKYLLPLNRKDDYSSGLPWAARNGFLEVVKFLLPYASSAVIKETFIEAVHGGRAEVVKFLLPWVQYSLSQEDINKSILKAALSGYLNVLELILPLNPEAIKKINFRYIVCDGHLGVVKFLYEQPGFEAQPETVFYATQDAIRYQHKDMVEFMLTKINDDEKIGDLMLFAQSLEHYELQEFMCQLPSTEGARRDYINVEKVDYAPWWQSIASQDSASEEKTKSYTSPTLY